MNAETISFWLLVFAAPPASLFVLTYGTTQPWYRSWVGWALVVFSGGLALLLDISLAYRIFGADYRARDALRLTVFSMVGVGSWLMLFALCRELIQARRHH